jgi:hypothetical protein
MFLQRRRLFGRTSISRRMVAPVVVNPDTVSKKASVKLLIYPDVIKGRAPNTARLIQQRFTSRKPSLVVSSEGFDPKGHKKTLKTRSTAMTKTK